MMFNLSAGTIVLFLGAAIFQAVGVSVLPLTQGMTKPVPIVVTFVCYAVGIWCMGKLIASGIDLGVMVPIITLMVIGGAIVIGIFAYGETPSMMKLGLLAGATLLLTFATTA
ncbi:hypothetical protein ACFSTD_18190 [Novosphingobium colocasiae]|nr:hypothetical protein [Novosphingobium colocasiae]